jgi:hypothetical protein
MTTAQTARIALLGIGAVSALAGVFIFCAPRQFHALVPGLAAMSPFSVHFIKDVGLIYLANGTAMAWAGWRGQRAVALAACGWFVLHALFHGQIWGHRGYPFDHVFLFDLVAVFGTAALALWAALQLPKHPA